MSELVDVLPQVRIDPLNGTRVIVAGGRAERPGSLLPVQPLPEIDPGDDPFAEGNESCTPPELFADRPGGGDADSPGWRVRCIPNAFPSLVGGESSEALADPLGAARGMPELLTSDHAHGAHEVIVNHPGPVSVLAALEPAELSNCLRVWALRVSVHAKDAAFVHVSTNEGSTAGATIAHTHTQLFGLPFVPPLVARERERMRAYHEHTQGRDLVQDLLAEEVRNGERLVAIDDHAALISPFAAASPYRLTIIPRSPEPRFEDSLERGAGMLFTALKALADRFGVSPPLNLWVRTAPRDAEHFCWRIEIAPRVSQPSGFELGTGSSTNSTSPELAAAELREVIAT
ncbi:MAG: galactose-1-phosphate uridylyltransferase [Solirubrobacterales bacterium]